MHDGYVYVKVHKGVYGLPRAGTIAQELLQKQLAKHGYSQSKITPGFWIHTWHPVGKEHADHLIALLEENYELDKVLGRKQVCQRLT